MNSDQKATIWNRQFIFAIAANLMLGFSQQSVNPLISTFAAYLGAGAVLTGLVTGLYFGVSVATRPFSGPIITKLDKRKIMIWTYLLGVITGLVYAISRNITVFIIARVLNGIEFAFVGSLTLTLASDSLPRDKLGTGIGIYGIGSAISTAIGPSMGIAVREWASGRWGDRSGFMVLFLLSAFFMLLGLIPVFLLEPNKPSKQALASLGAWYKNIAAKESLIPAGLACLTGTTATMVGAFLVPYAATKNIDNIGLYFTVSALTLLASRPLSGKLVDKFGINRIYYPSLALFLCTFVLLSVGSSLWVMLCAAVLSALGFGTLSPAIMTLCMRTVPDKRRGVASNTQYFGMDLGFFLGPTMGGFLYANFGYSNMFLLGAIPAALSAVLFFFGWRSLKHRLY